MFVQTFTAENYRNIASANLAFNPGCNILFGNNAQGKTNTAEAIYLALCGRSHRETLTGNLIGPLNDTALVTCEVFTDENSISEAKVYLGETKKHFIDSNPVRTRRELLSAYSVVFFTPEDLRLVTDSPGVRRNFMDEAISGLYPKYSEYLSQYNSTLRQRNYLLKGYGPSAQSMLEVYDEHLADCGSSIIKYRIDFLKKLSRAASEIYDDISGNSEEISFGYISNILTDNNAGNIREKYLIALEETRREDILSASTKTGVHHDDMDILLSGKPARKFGSRGQQRSTALCLKLALCDMTERAKGQKPVILLDDVMSELDSSRRSRVIELLSGRQVFITCVETNFTTPPGTAFFSASGGQITKT